MNHTVNDTGDPARPANALDCLRRAARRATVPLLVAPTLALSLGLIMEPPPAAAAAPAAQPSDKGNPLKRGAMWVNNKLYEVYYKDVADPATSAAGTRKLGKIVVQKVVERGFGPVSAADVEILGKIYAEYRPQVRGTAKGAEQELLKAWAKEDAAKNAFDEAKKLPKGAQRDEALGSARKKLRETNKAVTVARKNWRKVQPGTPRPDRPRRSAETGATAQPKPLTGQQRLMNLMKRFKSRGGSSNNAMGGLIAMGMLEALNPKAFDEFEKKLLAEDKEFRDKLVRGLKDPKHRQSTLDNYRQLMKSPRAMQAFKNFEAMSRGEDFQKWHDELLRKEIAKDDAKKKENDLFEKRDDKRRAERKAEWQRQQAAAQKKKDQTFEKRDDKRRAERKKQWDQQQAEAKRNAAEFEKRDDKRRAERKRQAANGQATESETTRSGITRPKTTKSETTKSETTKSETTKKRPTTKAEKVKESKVKSRQDKPGDAVRRNATLKKQSLPA